MTSPITIAPYVEPEIGEGDRYKPIEHVGSVLLVKVIKFNPSVVTPNSPDGGPAVYVDILDVTGGHTVFRNVMWMSSAMVDWLRPWIDQYVVIKIASKRSASGRMYPVPAEAAGEVAGVQAWLAQHGDPFVVKVGTITAPTSTDAPPF